MSKIKLNTYTTHGWILSGEYLAYKREGGDLSPSAWNQRCCELKKEKETKS